MQALRGFGVGQGVATEDIKHPSDHALLPFEGTAGGGNVLDQYGSWVRLRRTGGRVHNYSEIALAVDVTSTEAYAYGVDEVVFSSWGTKLLCDEQGGAQK